MQAIIKLIVLNLFFAIAINAQPGFSPKRLVQEIETEAPSSLAFCDIDNDGDEDLISVSIGDERISLFVNENGDLASPKIISQSKIKPFRLTTGDLNSDGLKDIIITCREADRILWLKNLGSLNFSGPFAINYNFREVSKTLVSDLDEDGDLDIVAISGTRNEIIWHENTDGNAFFSQAKLISGTLQNPTDLVVGDLNNDGDEDLVVSSSDDNKISIIDNLSGGNFSEPNTIYNLAIGANSLNLADLNGDNRLDIIASYAGNGSIEWFKQNVDRSFSSNNIVIQNLLGIMEIRSEDFDGDGDKDILAAYADQSLGLQWYENQNGLGNFSDPQIISDDFNILFSLAISDVNSDGHLDIATAALSDDRISLFENQNGNGFINQQALNKSISHVRKILSADLNQDGLMDIVSISSDNSTLAWYRNTGNGFTSQILIDNTAAEVYDMVIVDTNNDGHDDIAVINGHSEHRSFTVYKNINGLGIFSAPQEYAQLIGTPTSISSADYDLDGDNDIFITESGSSNMPREKIWLYRNLGGVNFTGSPHQIDGNAVGVIQLEHADINGDGYPDVIVPARTESQLSWFEKKSDSGTFYEHKRVIDDNASARWVRAFDLDNDNDLDLLAALTDNDQLVWYENLNGAGAFSSKKILVDNVTTIYNVEVADMNNDQVPDIIYSSYRDHNIVWLQRENNTSANYIASHEITNSVLNINSFVVADFDNDGDNDLGSSSLQREQIYWHENLQTNDCASDNFEISFDPCSSASFDLLATDYSPGSASYDYQFTNGSTMYSGAFVGTNLQIPDVNYTYLEEWTLTLTQNDNCSETYDILGPECGQECGINELSVIVGDCNEDGDTFSVVVDFVPQNVGNVGFDILIDNDYYGFYTYDQLPLTIPDLPNNGASSTLVVCDNDNVMCCADTEVPSPCVCNFVNITADPIECDDQSGTYSLLLNFTPTLTTSDSFSIGGNMSTYGFYALADLPVIVENFPLGADRELVVFNGTFDVNCFHYLELPDTDSCQDLSFDCTLYNLSYDILPCNTQGEFFVELDFEVLHPGSGFSFSSNTGVSYNGTYDNGPWVFGPFDGDCTTLYEFVIRDDQDSECQATFMLEDIICCTPPECEINNVLAEASVCDDDGLITIDISFDAQNPGNQGFSISGNGIVYGDGFQYGLDNYTIGPISPNCDQLMEIVISDNENLNCQSEFVFSDTLCCVQPCTITDAVLEAVCRVNQSNTLSLDFEYEGNTSSTFKLFIEGAMIGEFEYANLPVNIPMNLSTNQLYTVTIDDCNTECFYEEELMVMCGMCDFSGIIVEPIMCDDNGQFYAHVDFEILNPTANSFNIIVNDQSFGPLEYGENFYEIGPFEGDCETIYTFVVVDSENDECNVSQSLGEPICCEIPVCEMSDLSVDISDCRMDGSVDIEINFIVENPGSQGFTISLNGTMLANYEYSEGPYIVENVILPCNMPLFFEINDIEDSNCDIDLLIGNWPCCECELSDLNVNEIVCRDESSIDFQIAVNTSQLLSDSLIIFIDGVDIDTIKTNQLPYLIEGFPTNGLETLLVTLCGISTINECCIEEMITVPDCVEPECIIQNMSIDTTDCVDGLFEVIIDFDFENASSEFIVSGNGVNYGTFAYNDLPITISDLMGDGSTHYEFVVTDSINPLCFDFIDLGTIQCTSSTNEGDFRKVKLLQYSDRFVLINLDAGLTHNIEIYSLNGGLLHHRKMPSTSSISISTNNLPPSMYLIAVKNTEFVQVFKLIIAN